MAEQLALEKRFRQAAAGDLDEAPAAAAADGMDFPGEERFPRAALAGDEDRDPGVGDATGDVEHPADRRVAPKDRDPIPCQSQARLDV